MSPKHHRGNFLDLGYTKPCVFAGMAISLAVGCRPHVHQAVRAADFPLSGYTFQDPQGRLVRLEGTFPSGLPVLVTFMYTTCTTICPQEAATFATLQARLGENTDRVRIIALSMDPAHDTPQAMKAFLERFRAREGWTFLTGREDDLRRVRREFQDRVPGEGPSMPQVFLRSPRDGRWVRLSGSHSASEFIEVCRREGVL